MICRRAERGDATALVSLWRQAFGDDEAVIRSTLDALAPVSEIYVADEGGLARAMVVAVQETLCTPTDKKKATYFYALCTAESLRGRGIGRMLMTYAEEEERVRGSAAAFLSPAAGLTDYYRRLGYGPFSPQVERHYPRGGGIAVACDADAYLAVRERLQAGDVRVLPPMQVLLQGYALFSWPGGCGALREDVFPQTFAELLGAAPPRALAPEGAILYRPAAMGKSLSGASALPMGYFAFAME